MNRFFQSFYKRTGLVPDAGHRSVLSSVSSITVQGVIAFSLLGTLGVDTSPLIAAAGVTGATLGFACKDFGANFVASIALAGQPTLRTGNKVTIGTGSTMVKGTVVDWDTRYLYMRNEANAVVSVPNNLILNSVVTWEDPDAGSYPTAKGQNDGTEKEWKAFSSSSSSSSPSAGAAATGGQNKK